MKSKIIILLFSTLIFLALVQAVEWPMNKDQTCMFFNVSGTDCDSRWCNIISTDSMPCSYNTSLSSCLCTQTINNTLIINVSVQNTSSGNLTGFYNKSEIDTLILNLTNLLFNQSALDRQYFENTSRDLRNNLLDKVDNISIDSSINGYATQNLESPTPGWMWPMVIIVIVGAGCFLAWQKMQPKPQRAVPQTVIRAPHRKQKEIPQPISQKEEIKPIEVEKKEEIQEEFFEEEI